MDALAVGRSWSSIGWKTTLPFLKALPDAVPTPNPTSSAVPQNENSSDYPALVGAAGNVADDNLMSSIVGLWHLDEATGTTALGSIKDNSGNGLNGTPVGGVTMGRFGKVSSSAQMNGSTGYIDIGTPIASSNDMTISAWIFVNAYPASRADLISNEDLTAVGFNLALYSDAGFTTGYFNGAYTEINNNGSVVPLGVWTHLLSVRNSLTGKIYLYKNGILVNQGAAGTSVSSSSRSVYFGNSPRVSRFFNGLMDEVAIWSRALDPKEILQLYRRGANRVKYQVRNCIAATCSDDATGANWKGPDGTNQTYFSELDNRALQAAASSGAVLATPPVMNLGSFGTPAGTAVGTSRYFQYRAILESDDTSTACNYGPGYTATACSPEIKSVSVGPIHYDSSSPTIVGHTGAAYQSLDSFAESLGSACGSG
ncbi:MAG: LamG domain-containing protein, partial [Verrucomicrobiaceae bacterium]